MKNKEKKVPKSVKGPRFGVLDALIILLAIVIIVGVYFRYSIVEWISNSSGLKEYTISYSIDNIRYTTPNYINVGDKVYFADSGEEFGTLINVSESMGALSITLASEYFTTSQGAIVEVPYPTLESRVNAVGKLSCTGRYAEDGSFFVNGSTFISSGQQIKVNTAYATVVIRIDSIDAVEEG